jgi:hypothetical protein
VIQNIEELLIVIATGVVILDIMDPESWYVKIKNGRNDKRDCFLTISDNHIE